MKAIWSAAAVLAAPVLAWAAPLSRTALLSDIRDMRDFIPAKAQDTVNVKYRGVFAADYAVAENTKDLPGTTVQFKKDKNDYLNALFAAHHEEFGDDAMSFEGYVQKRLNLVVTLRRLQERKDIHLTEAQLKRVASWRSQLDEQTVSAADMRRLASSIGARHMKTATSRLDGGDAAVFTSTFRPPQRAPEAGRLAPPAVVYVAAQDKPQASSLGDLISGVVSRGKAYAQKVADAIFSSSAARNIDARLTAGIVWAESEFHAAVGSWAGCLGLGQLSEGVARSYGVSDRTDIHQNLKGTTGFLSSLLGKFTTHDERAYTQGLFAQNAVRVRRGADAGAVFEQMWPSIPDGMKNAVASYNAGPGAINKYGSWDKLPLPRASHQQRRKPSSLVFLALKGKTDSAGRPLASHCFDRPDQDNSYCQTIAYVPKVLKNYFTVFVETTPGQAPPVTYASADAERPAPGI